MTLRYKYWHRITSRYVRVYKVFNRNSSLWKFSHWRVLTYIKKKHLENAGTSRSIENWKWKTEKGKIENCIMFIPRGNSYMSCLWHLTCKCDLDLTSGRAIICHKMSLILLILVWWLFGCNNLRDMIISSFFLAWFSPMTFNIFNCTLTIQCT